MNFQNFTLMAQQFSIFWLWLTKYIIGEFFSSSGATLYKNLSDQTVIFHLILKYVNHLFYSQFSVSHIEMIYCTILYFHTSRGREEIQPNVLLNILYFDRKVKGKNEIHHSLLLFPWVQYLLFIEAIESATKWRK